MYVNWGQPGVPKGQLFSQEQGRTPSSTGHVLPQLDGSLYGTPVANTQSSVNRHGHFQGLTNNHGDSMFKAVDHQSPKPPMQPSAFNSSFLGQQGFGRQNLFEQAPIQGFQNENNVHNYQLAGNFNNTVPFQEFNGLQERGGLFDLMQDEVTQTSPAQSSATLDPLEQKILFGTNDNDWDPSFSGSTDLGLGSWSALMQSAAAETSCSDVVQHAGRTERSVVTGNHSNAFPGFQQPSFQVSSESNNSPQSSSHVLGQQSSKNGGNWLFSNTQQTSSMEGSQQGQRHGSLVNEWTGSDSDARQQSVSGIQASRQAPNTYHVDYMKNVDGNNIHVQSDSGANDHREVSNGPRGMDKSDHVGAGAYQKQPNGFQRDISNPFQHTNATHESREHPSSSARDYLSVAPAHQELHKQGSEEVPSYGHRFFGQANTFHNVSNSAMNFERGHLPEFQGNSKASEDLFSRGRPGSNISNSVDRRIVHNSQSLKAETADPNTQRFYNQPSVGLRLAPPSERPANQNFFQYSQSSPQMGNTSNQRQVNQELGENNTAWMAPPFAQDVSPSERAIPTEHHDANHSRSGQMGVRNSQLNMHGTSPGQIQRQQRPNSPPQFQSFQAFSGQSSRFLPSNAAPQDTFRQTNVNTFTHGLPVLEAVPVGQPSILSSLSEQGDDSVKPHNIWTKTPTHRLSSNVESPKVYSTDSLNNSLEATSFASEGQNEQNSNLEGIEVSQYHASLRDHQGMDYGRGKSSNKMQHQKPSKIHDAASPLGTFLHGQQQQSAQVHPQNFNRVWQGDKQTPASSSLEAYSHLLQKSDVGDQNESLLQTQAHATKNAEIYQGASTIGANLDAQPVNIMMGQQSFNGQNLTAQNHMGSEFKAVPNFQTGNSGNSFSGAIVNNNTANILPSQPMLNNHSTHMALPPFLPYGNIINGQMVSLSDPKAATNLEKSSLGLHAHASNLQVNSAMAGQVGSVWPNSSASLVVDEPSSTPFMSPSDKVDQPLVVTKLKKRKTAISELLPWHQEITQNSQRLQNHSVAQIEWAQATKRLIEKVEYNDMPAEASNLLIRPKKRLILTTQLIQQLMRPPPATILSADAASGFDSVAYCTAKSALGDACSMAASKKSDDRLSRDKSNTTPEKHSAAERGGDQFLSKVIEGFTGRTKKLENDLTRFDKKASMVDMLVDIHDLGKISIINRFAKFHVRPQADNMENSSNALRNAATSRMLTQRYVTALPISSRLPVGVNCLSL